MCIKMQLNINFNTRHVVASDKQLQVCGPWASRANVKACATEQPRAASQRPRPSNHRQTRPSNAPFESQRSRRGGSSSAPPPPPALVDNTRLVAIQQLLRIEEDGAFSGLVSGATARMPAPTSSQPPIDEPTDTLDDDEPWHELTAASTLTPAQQRTLRTLVSGVTRWRRRLDHIISSLTSKSVTKLDPSVRQVLRLALFELTHLSLAPHALGEFVSLARQVSGKEAATKLVNAVLRTAAGLSEMGTLPNPESELSSAAKGRDWARCMAISHSHPTWMVMKWSKRWSQADTVKLMEHNNKPPVYCVRVNRLSGVNSTTLLQQLSQQGVVARASPWLPDHVLEVTSGLQQLLAEGHVSEGRCCVQDVAAALVVALALAPAPGDRLLDACAAPGGKTLFAADLMNGQGSITALDISAPRVRAITRMAAACQVPPAVLCTQAADMLKWAPQQVKEAGGMWDKVLLDAPCSGTGVLSKRADLRWRRSVEDMQELVQLQGQLLDAAAPLVRSGGYLVYSTCSIEEDENMGVVHAFLQRHSEFSLQPITPSEAQAQGVPTSVISSSGCLEMLPHVHGTDGSFAARLVKCA